LKEIKKCLFLRLVNSVQPEKQTFSNSTGNGIENQGDRERTPPLPDRKSRPVALAVRTPEGFNDPLNRF
jgi:hypothetical protein